MAGQSAGRQHERIRQERRQRISEHRTLLLSLAMLSVVGASVGMHLLLGAWWLGLPVGLVPIANILAPSQREVAWRKGAEGEQAVGRALDRLGRPARVLHDRRIPGSRANIDHILIAPSGVWTIDTKNYTGKLETRRRGQELWIKGRNRSKLLDQARRQATVTQDVLAAAGLHGLNVRPALCFLGVEWPLLFAPKTAGDVALVSRRGLSSLANRPTTLSAGQIEQVVRVLDGGLRPAANSASPRSAPRAASKPGVPDRSPDRRETAVSEGDVTVKPWKRYGKNRLYVNRADGSTLGYVDLQTNAVVPADEQHRVTVRDAVADHLRHG